MTWKVYKASVLSALSVTCWALLIVMGAQILTMGLAFLRIPAQLAYLVASLPVHPLVIVTLIVLFYIILGMFIEAISMMLLTLPVVYPIMTTLGFDPIWLGVFMVVMIEMAQITPPVGVNLFVIHGITGKKYLSDIILGVIPFVLCQIVLLILIIAFPSLALWLPHQMIKKF